MATSLEVRVRSMATILSGDVFEGIEFGTAPGTDPGHLVGYTPLREFFRVDDNKNRASLLHVKYYHHPAGDDRGADKPLSDACSLTMLVSTGCWIQKVWSERTGRFVEVALQEPGDFIAWGTGLKHSWRANLQSTMLTVRWIPNKPAPLVPDALTKYGIVMQYLEYENNIQWTRSGFFLVVHAALLGFIGSSGLPDNNSALSKFVAAYALATLGIFLSAIWIWALNRGMLWRNSWHDLLLKLEPAAFDYSYDDGYVKIEVLRGRAYQGGDEKSRMSFLGAMATLFYVAIVFLALWIFLLVWLGCHSPSYTSDSPKRENTSTRFCGDFCKLPGKRVFSSH